MLGTRGWLTVAVHSPKKASMATTELSRMPWYVGGSLKLDYFLLVVLLLLVLLVVA